MVLRKYVSALKICLAVTLVSLTAGVVYLTLTSERNALFVALLALVFSPPSSLIVLALETYKKERKIFFLGLAILAIMFLNIFLLAGGI